MHALHFFDRGPLIAALVALLLTIVIGLGASELPSIELGGSSGATAASPAPVAEQPTGDPVWVRDPLAPPALLTR